MDIHLALVFYFLLLISFGIALLGYQDYLESRKINSLFETLDLNDSESTSRYLIWLVTKPTCFISAAVAGSLAVFVFVACAIVFGFSGFSRHFMMFLLTFLCGYLFVDIVLTYFQRHVIVPDGARSIMSKLSTVYLNEFYNGVNGISERSDQRSERSDQRSGSGVTES